MSWNPFSVSQTVANDPTRATEKAVEGNRLEEEKLSDRCWQGIAATLPESVLGEMLERNDPWSRPLKRTGFLCLYDQDRTTIPYLICIGAYRDVRSPLELARAIVADFPNLNLPAYPDMHRFLLRLYQKRFPSHFPPGKETHSLAPDDLDRLTRSCASDPFSILRDLKEPPFRGEVEIFFEDEVGWQCLLEPLVLPMLAEFEEIFIQQNL